MRIPIKTKPYFNNEKPVSELNNLTLNAKKALEEYDKPGTVTFKLLKNVNPEAIRRAVIFIKKALKRNTKTPLVLTYKTPSEQIKVNVII